MIIITKDAGSPAYLMCSVNQGQFFTVERRVHKEDLQGGFTGEDNGDAFTQMLMLERNTYKHTTIKILCFSDEIENIMEQIPSLIASYNAPRTEKIPLSAIKYLSMDALSVTAGRVNRTISSLTPYSNKGSKAVLETLRRGVGSPYRVPMVLLTIARQAVDSGVHVDYTDEEAKSNQLDPDLGTESLGGAKILGVSHFYAEGESGKQAMYVLATDQGMYVWDNKTRRFYDIAVAI